MFAVDMVADKTPGVVDCLRVDAKFNSVKELVKTITVILLFNIWLTFATLNPQCSFRKLFKMEIWLKQIKAGFGPTLNKHCKEFIVLAKPLGLRVNNCTINCANVDESRCIFKHSGSTFLDHD